MIVGGWLFGVAVCLTAIFLIVRVSVRRDERRRREVWDRQYGARL